MKVFISHAGKPQDDYPSALRSALTEQGLKVLERSFEENAFARVETSCEEADLVIFIVTHNFLQNSICLKELQWVLQHRHESCSKLSRPSIQVLLYPALRGYTKVQLNTMPPRDKQKHMETLERDSLSVDDVLKSATLKQTLQARQQAPVDLLEQLREVCRSHDACPRCAFVLSKDNSVSGVLLFVVHIVRGYYIRLTMVHKINAANTRLGKRSLLERQNFMISYFARFNRNCCCGPSMHPSSQNLPLKQNYVQFEAWLVGARK